MAMDLIGKSTELSEATLREAVTFITHDALDTMAALCLRRAESATRGSGESERTGPTSQAKAPGQEIVV